MNNKGQRRITIIGGAILCAGAAGSWLLFGVRPALLFSGAGAALLFLFLYYTKKRYEKIAELNDYLSRVLSGVYDPQIMKNEEGELSILQNNIYKATVQLQQKNELLAEEKRYLADMLANISHQLKTPLTSAMMMHDLLSEDCSEEKRQEFLDVEEKQLEKMNWLIQNLLKLSKLDAGTIEFSRKPVPVSELITESLAPFLIQMDLNDITVETSLTEDRITVDAGWTVEAIRNLFKNCLEHTQPGGRITIENGENHLYHTIFIRDNGCGISPEDLSRSIRGKTRPGTAAASGCPWPVPSFTRNRARSL